MLLVVGSALRLMTIPLSVSFELPSSTTSPLTVAELAVVLVISPVVTEGGNLGFGSSLQDARKRMLSMSKNAWGGVTDTFSLVG